MPGPDAIVPPALLSCSDRPEWVRFHERVHNELEETGFWRADGVNLWFIDQNGELMDFLMTVTSKTIFGR